MLNTLWLLLEVASSIFIEKVVVLSLFTSCFLSKKASPYLSLYVAVWCYMERECNTFSSLATSWAYLIRFGTRFSGSESSATKELIPQHLTSCQGNWHAAFPDRLCCWCMQQSHGFLVQHHMALYKPAFHHLSHHCHHLRTNFNLSATKQRHYATKHSDECMNQCIFQLL